MTETSIRPGQPWLDTNGNRIHAHSGSILFEDGVFYWYGENKEHTSPGWTGNWHWGVRCYSSVDLINWEDRGLIIPPTPHDPGSPLHPERFMDRPHIIKNPDTGTYVCWIKIMGEGLTQRSTVLVADTLLGPYEMVASDLKPLGMHAGDFDLVVDPTDGKGYYYFERVHSELICADLTPDFLNVTGFYSTHFPHPNPPDVREAPSYFRRGSKHYLITSGTSGYFPNPSEIAVADSYHGPWTVLGDPHPDDETRTSYRSQIGSIFHHPLKKDLYIALGDRWLPELSPEDSDQRDRYRRLFEGESAEDVAVGAPSAWNAEDTRIADYVWLPIRFDGDVPRIDWVDEWSPDDYE
jgi:hypothetical protein